MTFQLSPLHCAVAIIFFVAFRWMLKKRNSLPLPPGPPRLPFLGNALDMPKHDAHETFREMNAKYGASWNHANMLTRADLLLVVGDVMYLEVLGQPMVILGSHEAALDLLEKRSAIYSDRVPSVMVEL